MALELFTQKFMSSASKMYKAAVATELNKVGKYPKVRSAEAGLWRRVGRTPSARSHIRFYAVAAADRDDVRCRLRETASKTCRMHSQLSHRLPVVCSP